MLTKRRLYFLLPDVASAHDVMNDLLLARIEVRRMHFLANRGALPPELPEATVLQKTDVIHGAELGMVIGGVAGTLGGLLAVFFPPEGASLQLITVLVAAVIGALLGAWASSLAGSAVPNSRLTRFAPHLQRGKVLMMVDVPLRDIDKINELVTRRHPDVIPSGFEPTLVFP
jgi:hypothetical protein